MAVVTPVETSSTSKKCYKAALYGRLSYVRHGKEAESEETEENQKIQYLIISSMLKQRLKGLTGGVTPVFPKICFELKKGNNLNTEDKYFRQILKTFLEAIKRNEYLRILKEDRVLTSKLEEYMEKWKYEDDTDFTREKVAQYMSSYKQLRAIIFSFEKYNNRVKQKRR